MVFLVSPPHPALQHYIHQYWYLSTDDPSEFGQLTQMMFPVDFGGLSFYFCARKPVIEHYANGIKKRVAALYTGLITSPGSITFEPHQPIEGFVVAFLPHGYADLFQYDVSKVTDRLPDFFELEREGEELYRQIKEAKDFATKTALADAFFLQKLPPVDQTAQIREAIDWILISNGLLDVEQLAQQVGMSWKTLERHFRKRVGVSPKMYARFKRFHHALSLLSDPTPRSWLEIAHTCGYYDQAHFIKEFQQFTNRLPSAFSAMDYPLFYRFIIQKR